MRAFALLSFFLGASATILQNGQVRENPYPGQAELVSLDESEWKSYAPDAAEISYKGRWDEQHISWWSAPGLKFAFTGQKLALSFGKWTDQGVLVAYRLGGLEWQFSNVTANSTYQFISPSTTGVNYTDATDAKQFELRVTNWSLGVQLAGVSVDSNAKISKIKEFGKMVEIIGDSLSAGQYASYEAISSWAYAFTAGLGNVEYSLSAYPGICLHDRNCWGNAHGQTYQWWRTSDVSYRSTVIYGDNPPKWNFKAQQPADLVVINIGTNDANAQFNVTSEMLINDYIYLIDGIHKVWPKAQVVIMSLWGGFGLSGNTYVQGPTWPEEIKTVYNHYRGRRDNFVHYFDTTGILQVNDIAPLWHPTDVGHIKLASHLMQWVKIKFGWELGATGPEVLHDTLYWNDQSSY